MNVLRPRTAVVAALVLAFASACAGNNGATASTSPGANPPSISASVPASPADATVPATDESTGPTKAGEPTVESEDDVVLPPETQYPRATPTGMVHIPGHDASGELRTADPGNHQDADPKYSRVTFRFWDAAPAYSFGYVPAVPLAAKEGNLKLPGAKFLQIIFEVGPLQPAVHIPVQATGFPHLKGFGCGSAFEGKVICGLGTDAVLPVETTYLVRPSDVGTRLEYDIAFDVTNG